MSTLSAKNIYAENLHAALPHSFFKHETRKQKRMCWKCQKDKHTVGGHLKMFTGGTMKFICSQCLAEKLKAKNA